MTGILLVDKPTGVTSHDVVAHLRRAANLRRIGHTGTLDPAATGLLILCLGQATRLSEFFTGMDKVYEGAMRLGVTTDSYDMDGKIVAEHPVPPLAPDDIQAAFNGYTGEILQTPPMVSAVKVKGERLYKKARKGETVERAPRAVVVKEFLLLDYDHPPLARFRVKCTRGTYARSLCHDVGNDLGCGATLQELRRTWVGAYAVAQAAPMDVFQSPKDIQSRLVSVDNALDLPEVTVLRDRQRLVHSGGALIDGDLSGGTCPVDKGWVQVKSERGKLLAVGEVQQGPAGKYIQPRRVMVA